MTPYTFQPERFSAAVVTADLAPSECDVLVIGGGPAGCTAAALLAEQGVDVLIVEKNVHPRFHIGESLLPRNLAIMDRLGIRDRVAAMGIFKGGGEFVCDVTGDRVTFDFSRSLNPAFTHAYQVPRAPFDELLFDTAAAKGARTMQATRVADVEFAAPGQRARVTAVEADGTTHLFAPRFILDASGRDTVIAGKLGAKKANKSNTTAACYAHFRNVTLRPDGTAGYVSIHLAEDGWFWMIPLPDDVMSVGFVGDQSAFKKRGGATMEQFFAQRINASASVAERMQSAERISDVTGTGNYSYRSRTCSGEGYMLIGDAYGFIDPVFSSGVLLAMTAGEFGAEVAATWLKDARAGAAQARVAERRICRGMDNLGWVVYRINDPVMRHMFLNPSNKFKMRDGLVALLAGNLEIERGARLPVMAFKTVYYLLTMLNRFTPIVPQVEPPMRQTVAAE